MNDADSTHQVQPTTALAETGPMSLLRLAVERGAGASELEKLAALAERLEANRAEAAFAAAFCGLQSECPPITKSRKVMNKDKTSERYRFAAFEDILPVINPLLSKYKIAVAFSSPSRPDWFSLDMTLSVGSCSKVYPYGAPMPDVGKIAASMYMTEPQAWGMILSYHKRYHFINVFKLTIVGEDNDCAIMPQPSEGILADQVAELLALTLAAWPAEKPRQINIERHVKWVATASKRDVAAFDQFDQEQFRLSKQELLAIIAERNKPK